MKWDEGIGKVDVKGDGEWGKEAGKMENVKGGRGEDVGKGVVGRARGEGAGKMDCSFTFVEELVHKKICWFDNN